MAVRSQSVQNVKKGSLIFSMTCGSINKMNQKLLDMCLMLPLKVIHVTYLFVIVKLKHVFLVSNCKADTSVLLIIS
jgi:hypothetical protein